MIAINSDFSLVLRTHNCEVMDGPLVSVSSHEVSESFLKISRMFVILDYFRVDTTQLFINSDLPNYQKKSACKQK
jgi:hypothetical protein